MMNLPLIHIKAPGSPSGDYTFARTSVNPSLWDDMLSYFGDDAVDNSQYDNFFSADAPGLYGSVFYVLFNNLSKI